MTTHSSDTRTEADAIADLALTAAEGQPLTAGTVYAFHNDRGDVEIIDSEQYGDVPQRKRGDFTVLDAPSFLEYFKKHSSPDSEVWADITNVRVTGVLNAHAIDKAGWGDHRLVLNVVHTEAWQAWLKFNGKLIDQVDFAEHVEARLIDFVKPSGAEMLELAQSFHAKRSAQFESSKRLSDGETQLEYREETSAQAGKKGQLAIPDSFDLALVPFEGSPAYKVTARFRYRITGMLLMIGYVLDRPEDIIRAAFTDIVTAIDDGIDPPVLRGIAPPKALPAR